MSKIRFIHTADLHLDSPFKGMTGLPLHLLNQLRDSTFTAFTSLIEYALKSKPDFLLIVGDIYDGEDRSLRAQMKFHEGMKRLDEAGISVYISHGNHDHLSGRWTRFEMPKNVYIFNESVESVHLQFNGQDVCIHGFSYKERHVREVMIGNYPVATNEQTLHIGMLHGSLAGNETHAVYAPFTKSELLEKHYDYWALGHIHQRQSLSMDPPIIYPGNIQGRHRNEGGSKGFYEVELSKTDATLSFVPTSAIVFERLGVSCTGISHANEWLAVCKEVLDVCLTKYGSCIVELTMTDIDEDATELFQQSTTAEWLQVLRESYDDQQEFIWIQKISFISSSNEDGVSNALIQSVMNQMDCWNIDEWKCILKDMYQHAKGIKYLDVLKDEDIQEIKLSASELLTKQMSETE